MDFRAVRVGKADGWAGWPAVMHGLANCGFRAKWRTAGRVYCHFFKCFSLVLAKFAFSRGGAEHGAITLWGSKTFLIFSDLLSFRSLGMS